MFKSKDPKSFDKWLDQIDKVTSLINKDPYKLALAESQGSFSKTISSYPPTLVWNKIRECLCYKFGSVATKQHTASMLIDQQQKPSETSQEYIKRFSDLLLKSSGLLLHQAKYLVYITHFIRNLHNQKLQHYIFGKNATSVQNIIRLAQKKDAEPKIIEGLYNHDSGHKINNMYPNCSAMHVMVVILLKTVMEQHALDVTLISIIIYHLNALENASPTNYLATIILTTITMVMDTEKSAH